jgi:hypothetical protein
MSKEKQTRIADLPRGGVYLFHLNPGQSSGLSREPGKEGKLRLDQNDGEPVPLAQIPDVVKEKSINITFHAGGSAVSWSSQPVALTEFLGDIIHRLKIDLTNLFTQARLLVNVAAAGDTNAELRAQYSTDQSSWYYLDDLAGPRVSLKGTGLEVSSWIDLCDGAKADVFLRLVGINGDGSESPRFGLIAVQLR